MSLTIRPYDESDEEVVVALWERCGLVVPWNDPHADIARKLAVGRELFLVGEVEAEDGAAGADERRVVAGAMGGYEGHRGWINYLAVDPAWRGRGFGRAIMEAVEALLRARGCPKINLQVRRSNAGVIAFYEAIGFREDDAVSMGKRLVEDGPASAEPPGTAEHRLG